MSSTSPRVGASPDQVITTVVFKIQPSQGKRFLHDASRRAPRSKGLTTRTQARATLPLMARRCG